MSINKATLAKEVNGVIEYIYPKTTSDIVEYNNGINVENKLDSIDMVTSINKKALNLIDNTEIIQYGYEPVYALSGHGLNVYKLSLTKIDYANFKSDLISIPKNGMHILYYTTQDTNGVSILCGYICYDNNGNQVFTQAGTSEHLYITKNMGEYLQLNVRIASNGNAASETSVNEFFKYYNITEPEIYIVVGKLEIPSSNKLISKGMSLSKDKNYTFTVNYLDTGYLNRYHKAYFLPLKNVNKIFVDTGYYTNLTIFDTDFRTINHELHVEPYGLLNNSIGPCIEMPDEYKNNYAIIFVGERLNNRNSINSFINQSGDVVNYSKNKQNIGIYNEFLDHIYIEYNGKHYDNSVIYGGNHIIAHNIQLVRKLHNASGGYHIDGNKNHYVQETNKYPCCQYGSGFWYTVSPSSYFTALLNPNSIAYGGFIDKTEHKYSPIGINCAQFANMLTGSDVPYSTWDLRYNPYITEYERKEITDFYTEFSDFKKYDIVTRTEDSSPDTGHSQMIEDVRCLDDELYYIDILESASSATQENSYYLIDQNIAGKHISLDFHKDYHYLARPNEFNYLDKIDPWDAYYDQPQKIMCSRGYNNIYLLNSSKIILSIDTSLNSINIYKDDDLLHTVTIPESTDINLGYYVFDITGYCDVAGRYNIKDDNNEANEQFYVIDASDYKYTTEYHRDVSQKWLKPTHADEIKYIEIMLKPNTNTAKYALMHIPPNIDNDWYIKFNLEYVSNDTNIAWSNDGMAVSVYYKSGFGENAFFIKNNEAFLY